MADRILFLETPDIPNTPVGEEQGSGGGAVDSVNGKTGVVVLDASDVGALPSSYTPPVSSVNGKTGAVVLGAADVNALPDSTVIPPTVTEQTVANWGFTKNTGTYSKPSGGIPVSDLADGVIPEPFVIPFTQEEYGDEWVFDSNTLTPLQIFNGIKDAQDKIGVIACVTNRQTGDVVYYPAFNMLAESADPEDDPCVFCAFLDNIGHFVVCNFQVNPYSPDPHSRISVDMVDYDYIKSPSSGSIGDFLCKTSSGEAWASVNIPTKVSDLTNDSGYQTAAQVQTAIAGKADKTTRIAMTAQDTTPTLGPNKLYVFPEMASLAITLAAPADLNIVNEYHFIFTSGATATVLTLPASVLQPDGFTVEANHVYEVSILENCMTAQGWAVSA